MPFGYLMSVNLLTIYTYLFLFKLIYLLAIFKLESFTRTEKSCKKLLGEGRASLECHAPNHTKTQAAILEVANIYYGPKI